MIIRFILAFQLIANPRISHLIDTRNQNQSYGLYSDQRRQEGGVVDGERENVTTEFCQEDEVHCNYKLPERKTSVPIPIRELPGGTGIRHLQCTYTTWFVWMYKIVYIPYLEELTLREISL